MLLVLLKRFFSINEKSFFFFSKNNDMEFVIFFLNLNVTQWAMRYLSKDLVRFYLLQYLSLNTTLAGKDSLREYTDTC